MNILYSPWPWYVVGPLIGLTVPMLLLLGNKRLGISSTLRHICTACFPGSAPLFNYDWRNELWSLFFATGVLLGGFLAGYVFANPDPVAISPGSAAYLRSFGLSDQTGLMPSQLFNWDSLASEKGFLIMILGGFMVGFGTRYARGCTSGHGIFGLSAIQWPSLVATMSFFIGGIIFSHFVLPYILRL